MNKVTLVCGSDKGPPELVVANSVHGQCSECGGGLWIAPSSIERIKPLEDVYFICSDCFMRSHLHAFATTELNVTDEQMDEVRKTTGDSDLSKEDFMKELKISVNRLLNDVKIKN